MSEVIGECETCGVVDHHLVEGQCGECRMKFGLPEPPPEEPMEEST